MPNRRQFTMGGVLATLAVSSRAARAQDREIRMVEAGGKSGESIEVGYIQPFTAKTGVRVVRESPNQLGKLRALVQSRVDTTTLFELGSTAFEQAKALGLLEPLDWARIDPLPMFPEAKDPQGFGYQYFSTIMAWRPGAKPLASWADFFNARDFPGKRTLADTPQLTLPAAALASGVAPDALYPLDLDRAFKQLEAAKGDIAIWWQSGAQAPQLLRDNEVQYAMTYSGRVAGEGGIAYTFRQGLLELAYFGVVRGAKRADVELAAELFHAMSVPENQAKAATVISYTGPSPDLERLLPRERLGEFPTSAQNKSVQALSNGRWWFENAEVVQRRWEEFKLGL